MSSSTTAAGPDDKRLTKHGFPKGFRFVPTNLELVTILGYKINGRRLPPKVAAIFHDLNILDYHPKELHDQYESDMEHRYIYFFSWRQFQRPAGGGRPAHRRRQRGAGGQDEEVDNEPRPVRLAKGGGWKPSGGGHVLRWPKEKGSFVAGKMVTMVFYDHRGGEQVKSQWGMHEFTVPVNPRLLSKPTKTTRFHDLALYRLYKLKSDNMKSNNGDGSNQTLANVAAANGHLPAPRPAGKPSFGAFTARNQPLAAGASTSRMPPPQPQPQHRMPNVGRPQYYHHQHQYAFGAAPASAAAHQLQQVRTRTMPPPAYGARMPGRQLLPFATPPGTRGLPPLQFARPPAPWMAVPPAAANPAPASHQQAPATATYGGAGQQQASHPGATRSLPSAPVPTLPPAEELAPVTATHGGAGRDATATAEAKPGEEHVQFADCVQPEEERVAVPPPTPIEDKIPADNYGDGIGTPDMGLDLGMGEDSDDRFLFTMDELWGVLEEPPSTSTQQGDNN